MDYITWKEKFLDYILADATVATLISARIQYGNPFTTESIHFSYPAATVLLAEGYDYLGIVKGFPGQIFGHSDKTFDEAGMVIDAIATRIDNAFVNAAAVVRIIGNPTQNYIGDPRLYNVYLPFTVTLL